MLLSYPWQEPGWHVLRGESQGTGDGEWPVRVVRCEQHWASEATSRPSKPPWPWREVRAVGTGLDTWLTGPLGLWRGLFREVGLLSRGHQETSTRAGQKQVKVTSGRLEGG